MPLTIVHPIAVYPFKRWGLPLSALVIGSIAPDLEYLAYLAPVSKVSHTLVGLFLFCLPAGLIFLWIFHRIWKQPILSQLLVTQSKVEEIETTDYFSFLPLRRFTTLCIAILLGAMTHLIWDSFTHQYGWMVLHIPALSTLVFQNQYGALPLFKLFQHSSTGFGFIILALIALRHRYSFERIKPALRKKTILICSIGVSIALVYSFIRLGLPIDIGFIPHYIGISIVTFFAVLILEITILSLIWYRIRKKP